MCRKASDLFRETGQVRCVIVSCPCLLLHLCHQSQLELNKRRKLVDVTLLLRQLEIQTRGGKALRKSLHGRRRLPVPEAVACPPGLAHQVQELEQLGAQLCQPCCRRHVALSELVSGDGPDRLERHLRSHPQQIKSVHQACCGGVPNSSHKCMSSGRRSMKIRFSQKWQHARCFTLHLPFHACLLAPWPSPQPAILDEPELELTCKRSHEMSQQSVQRKYQAHGICEKASGTANNFVRTVRDRTNNPP